MKQERDSLVHRNLDIQSVVFDDDEDDDQPDEDDTDDEENSFYDE